MKLEIYQVDAFADRLFEGNPAAVIPLESWLPDHILQMIALENNLSETAFYTPDRQLRWFTPLTEVPLCGHATLAAAFVYFNRSDESIREVTFHSKSGDLTIHKNDDSLTMDFPSLPYHACDLPVDLVNSLNIEARVIEKIYLTDDGDYFLILDSETSLSELAPNFSQLKQIDCRGVIATAAADKNDYDFVSRFFVPSVGIDEDPVTGSVHCVAAPAWADRLGKTQLTARQISSRGGNAPLRGKKGSSSTLGIGNSLFGGLNRDSYLRVIK